MRDGVDWRSVGSGERFEKIISTLLSTLHKDSERIDGRGGDGGRDHQLRVGDALHIWQSKYYLNRLSESKTRKGKIKASLDSAAKSDPASWSLVTPMIPNRTERDWFDDLASDYPFPLYWRGGDWLEANLANYPSIVRHFMSAEEEFVALLREFKDEQAVIAEAAVHGLSAARSRIELLADKLNESNPFYRVDFSVENGRIVDTTLRPKYRDAEKDSPVTLQFTVVSGDEQPDILERLAAALEWGDEIELLPSQVRDVVISAPHGFGGNLGSGHLKIGPADEEKVEIGGRMMLEDPSGRRVASIPIQWLTRVAGTKGVTICGKDLLGVVEVQLKVVPAERRFALNLTATWSRPLLPGAVLPILRFQRFALPPYLLSVSLGDLTTRPVPVPGGLWVADEVVQFAANLDEIQSRLGESFPMPRRWTASDLRESQRVIDLLNGKRVARESSHINLESPKPDVIREAFRKSPGSLQASSEEPLTTQVAGHELELGPYSVYIPRAELVEGDTVEGTTSFKIVPSAGTFIEMELDGISET